MVRELEKLASAYACRAVELDRKGKAGDAVRMYLKAIRVLSKLLALRPGLKDFYIARLRAYRKRVEELSRSSSRVDLELDLTEPGPSRGEEAGRPQKPDGGLEKAGPKPSITWDDIVDLEEAKRAIKEAIVYPVLRPDLFPEHLTWPRGILLFGPPGCGKTLLASAVAHEIEADFMEVSGADIMNKWLGEAEKNVARLFSKAREIASSGRPVVIFIDEVDSLFGTYNNEVGGEVRVRNQFLREMDGINDKRRKLHIYVIGATNKPWNLDPPFIRRFQRRILVPPPNFEARMGLFKLYTRGMELAEDVDFEELAHMTKGYTGSDIRDICMDAYYSTVRELFESGRALKPGTRPRPVSRKDFIIAIRSRRPSIKSNLIRLYYEWYEEFGAV
ncbi:AAA family ATPase [Candidatus Bathyarchaeota archaeon]|nr:MAG: AAA family ATPase [Candidatus Bathyarchaeota archaeon]